MQMQTVGSETGRKESQLEVQTSWPWLLPEAESPGGEQFEAPQSAPLFCDPATQVVRSICCHSVACSRAFGNKAVLTLRPHAPPYSLKEIVHPEV